MPKAGNEKTKRISVKQILDMSPPRVHVGRGLKLRAFYGVRKSQTRPTPDSRESCAFPIRRSASMEVLSGNYGLINRRGRLAPLSISDLMRIANAFLKKLKALVCA